MANDLSNYGLGSAADAIASLRGGGTDLRARLAPVNEEVYGGTGINLGAAGQSSPGPINGGMDGIAAAGQMIAAATFGGVNMDVRGAAQTLLTSGGGDTIMKPLRRTKGILFPYSPQIQFNQTVDYTTVETVHSNMDVQAYRRTPSVELSVSGKFTVQSQEEGQYALACLHFLRTVSKMEFGEAAARNNKAGLPPPMLHFSAYGTYMFNKLRVILKSHSFSYEENMDTVEFPVNGAPVRLPAMFTIQMTLVVQRTPHDMRKKFNLDLFRTGALMRDGGWI